MDSSSTNKRDSDLKLQYFQIRHQAKLCVAFVCFINILNRFIVLPLNSQITHQIIINTTTALPFYSIMIIIIALEHILIKKRGPKFAKYSKIVDIVLLLLFMGDWILLVVQNLKSLQQTNPPCFKMSSVFAFMSFSWRTLLVTLVVENWFLKMIAPVVTVFITAGYAIYFDPKDAALLVSRTLTQLLSVILIVYCEDKVKWKIMWTTFQHEKWMQVNNFILDNIPENIMILDLEGEVKYINDHCQSFMEKFNLALETKDILKKIQDLQKQYEAENSVSIPIERLASRDELLTEVNEKILPDSGGLLKAETLEDLIENFKDLIAQKKLQERQFAVYNGKLRVENSQDRSIEAKISFLQYSENNFIISMLRDMTQRDLLVTLEETNKYKDQLLASVSHELRAPLNGNINLVESAVESEKIPQDIKESLLIPALRISKFLLHIINDIIDMSQIKEKKLRLVFESGNIKETLLSTVQLVELQAKKKSLDLVIDLDRNLPKNFVTDHLRLSQIVLNLLNNAIKFTKEGAVKLIAKPWFQNSSCVKITVEDSGIGMTKEDLQKLFYSYTHIEFPERPLMNPAGVGLGLNIAYNLAGLLAPKSEKGISVLSVPKQGSSFSFIIENKEVLSPPRLEELSDSSAFGEVNDELAGIARPIFFSKKQQINTSMIPFANRAFEPESTLKNEAAECLCQKVLIVDDNPFNTMAFETILGSLKIKGESVYSGCCAIKQLLGCKAKTCGASCKLYSVVFMDQEMPEMNGIETVKEIRRLQGEDLIPSGIKVIGCTAHKAKEDVDRFLAAGLDQCIHKPISKVMINDILKNIL